MKLESIEVRRLPGIERPYRVDGLSGGVNLIVGPNGAGKSSLCRAVNATLWPSATARPDDEVTTLWARGDVRLRAQLAGVVRWTDAEGCDGAPALPDPEMRRCLILGMRDLLEAEADEDSALAERLRVQMAGGFDLRAVSTGFGLRRSHGKSEQKDLATAQRALNDLQSRRRDLASDVDSLASLEQELAEARSAERTLGRLRAAADLAAMRDELAEKQYRLGGYPSAMETLRGDELGRLKDLDRELEAVAADREEADRRLVDAHRRLESCALPGGPVERAELNTWLGRARELAQWEQEAARLESVAAAAREALDGASQRLGGELGKAHAGRPIDSAAAEQLEAWVLEAFGAAQKRELLETRLGIAQAAWHAGHELDEKGLEDRVRAVGLLDGWLSLRAEPPARAAWARAAASGVLSGGLAGGLTHVAMLVGEGAPVWFRELTTLAGGFPGGSAAVWGAAAATFGLLGLGLAWPRSRVRAARRLEHQFAELASSAGLRELQQCGPDEVRARQRELREVLRGSDETKARRKDAESIAREVALLAPAETSLEARRLELCERFGVQPSSSSLAVADLFDRLKRHRALRQEVEVATGELAACRARCDERGAELYVALSTANPEAADATPPLVEGERPVLDAAGAMAQLDDLQDRSARWRQAGAEAEAAQRDVARGERQREDIERRQTELLQATRVEGPDVAGVRRLLEEHCGDLEHYRRERSAVSDIRARIEGLVSNLADSPELASLSREEIAERSEQCGRLAEGRERLSSQIALIEKAVEDACGGDDLEQALANERDAVGALAERREERLACAAGELLMEEVEAEYEEQSRPEVLECAMELFAVFSEHRYALRLVTSGDDGATFRAVEAASGRERRLTELSDGTRMQLLLAARLAFAMQAEQGDALPLFLDEALTASDPDRFRAVAESLLHLSAAQGRQIFYLTCSPGDVDYWCAIAAERKAEAPHVVDLAEVRRLEARSSGAARLEAPPPRVVPAPAGSGAAAYGAQLGVEVPGPLSRAASVHLFHLLRDDLPLLHRLLSDARVETVGHWRLLAGARRAACGLSEREVARIDAWAALAESFFEEVRTGRGAPVDRAVLHASGAVSGSFLDRLSELASELGGDARALLEALERGEDERAKRFLTRNRNKLADYFTEHGQLTREVPHSLAEVRVRCLASAAPSIERGDLSSREVADRVEQWFALVAGEGAAAETQVAPPPTEQQVGLGLED